MREYQSAEIKDLAAALCKAQADMKHATKAADNPFFKSKYADLPAVIDAVRPLLAANGLSISQMMDYDESGKTYLVTMLMHSSGQWLRGWYPINPTKNDPQGVGSAVTYARRYSLSGMVGIASIGEDDDGNAASVEVKPETAVSRNKRFAALKKELTESDDPAVTWHENLPAIKAFQESDQTFYDDLVVVAKKRKEELSQMEAVKAGFPPQFNGAR